MVDGAVAPTARQEDVSASLNAYGEPECAAADVCVSGAGVDALLVNTVGGASCVAGRGAVAGSLVAESGAGVGVEARMEEANVYDEEPPSDPGYWAGAGVGRGGGGVAALGCLDAAGVTTAGGGRSLVVAWCVASAAESGEPTPGAGLTGRAPDAALSRELV